MRVLANSLAASLSVFLITTVASCSSRAGSPDLWLADFEHLKTEMATGYANLEWSAEHNRIDLPQLVADTEAELRRTSSARKARKIVIEFLEAFGDPHLRAKKTDPPTDSPVSGGAWTGPSNTASSKEALEAFGYRKGKYDFGVDFESLDGFTALGGGANPFPAGVLTSDDGRKFGVIRIKYFGDDRYHGVAESAWEDFKRGLDGPCDESDWWPFTLMVRERLMEYLQERLRSLRDAGATAIVVDITGNGGGSEWCEDVARLFTTKTLVPPPAGFVKHTHWLKQIERELSQIDEDLARDDLPPALGAMLVEARAAHEKLRDDILAGCAGDAIWREGHAGEGCERIAFDEHGRYTVPAGADSTAASLSAEHILFEEPRHPDFVGLYDGPLFVVIDHGTASASEQFATLLQYNEAATIVGETSYGAGCGYTRGGIKLYLENLELRVWMPDCVRVRADGENELAGVEPDVPGWKDGEKGKTRARSLAEALRRVTPADAGE